MVEHLKANWKILKLMRDILMNETINFTRIPWVSRDDAQILYYPGLKLQSLLHLFIFFKYGPDSPNPGRKPRKVVISCGLNDKTLAPSTTNVALGKIINKAKRIFPGSEIYLAQIAFSSKLPISEQNNLKIMNDKIKSLATQANIKYIPCIPANKFEVGSDNIHWKENCAQGCPFGTLFRPFTLDPDHGSEPRVPQLGKSVINLSKYPLSDIEQSVLDKGLNFIPTPKNVTKIPIMEAASNFGRRLKIAYHFRESKVNHQPEKFIDKSKWEPPDKSMLSEILETIQNINTDLTNMEVPKHTQNLPNAELAALKQLRSNPFIVIKPADKGSSSVIMDKDNYISEGYRQLDNPSHYKKLDKPIFQST